MFSLAMALKSAGGKENDCCDNVQELRKETSTKQKRLWNIFTMASYILRKEPMVVPGRTQHELQLDRTLKIFRTASQQYVLNCWACYEFVRHRPPDHAVALRQGIGNEGSFVAFGRLLIGSEHLMIEGLICDGAFQPNCNWSPHW